MKMEVKTGFLLDSESDENIEKDYFLILFSNPETARLVNIYLQHEYSSENFDFIMSVFEYQSASDRTRKILAKTIYKTYIMPESPKQINIPWPVAIKISENLKTASSSLFLNAKTHVLNLMKCGFFPRFSKNVSGLIKKSWSRIIKKYSTDKVGIKFYEYLFEEGPEVIPLFKHTNYELSRKMFVQVIERCIKSLDDLKQVIIDIDDLAKRHRKYGVNKGHMKIAGKALIKVLEDFDDEWEKQTEEAWLFVFSLISALMKRWLPDDLVKNNEERCTLQ
jgi:hemoglobin-like flavoprotein